jgi:hypothetical protein
MLIRPSVLNTAAPITAALALGIALQPSTAEARCDSTFRLPMGNLPRECQQSAGSDDLAEGIAFDSSGGRGEEYTYEIELLSGGLATGILLDQFGEIVRARDDQDASFCPLVLDFFPDDGEADGNFCVVRIANSATHFQVSAD